ncbi:Putative zn(2)Cys(6) fungal-type DNA-binding domain-containing protein [Colletotrichum destructivum]|uniref:Zn(2)Cys(6) fungal-type DNA-binding domain-containing protein n=1 Tax=Colletotrichum destructivum TaxID=34406 RepID=A0AAX4IUU6_9PEZI|nr:Putative zn(2)Cys(6) fungal-type DNA-binding domain-containing protein [Colletotrichum destructivum]
MSTVSSPSPSTGSPQPERARLPSIARWGAACAQCASAKAKCLRSNDTPGSKCDRCERLFKTCTAQIHKKRKKRHSKPSKTTQLEDRLNRLVNSLRVSGNTSALTAEASQPASFARQTPLVADYSTALPSGHPGPDFYTQTPESPCTVLNLASAGPINIPESYNSFVPPKCICRPEPGEAPPPPDTDENLLKIYRRELAPRFPFVLVPDGVSASTLGATRPFLMAAIRMVASYRSTRSRRGQMYRLLNHVADYMMLRSERSFDLLLGLVVMIAWFHHHCLIHAQLNQLVSLAACLVGELGLKSSPSLPERTRLLVMRPWELRERTNEERRVLLAVWYLSSAVSMEVRQIDPMRYSGYMQQCMRELQESGEHESDMHLVYIVKIQRLCERIYDLRSQEDADGEEDTVSRAPVSAYVSGFRAELNKLQTEMPPRLRHNPFLKIRMATARLRIHEPPNIDAELLASLSKSLDYFGGGGGPSRTLDAFYQSNAALKAWFDTWLSMPEDSFCTMPISTTSHMVYAVMMLSRWAWLASSWGGGGGGGDNSLSTTTPTLTSEPLDPSEGNPNVTLAAIEAAISPNTPAAASSSSSPPAAQKAGSCNGGNSGSSPWQTTLPDKKLPHALVALRARLATQPGLILDAGEYLDRVVAQLERFDAAYRAMSVDGGRECGNIWSLGATKVKIARLRHERWFRMVAAQAEVGEMEEQVRWGGPGVGGPETMVGEVELQDSFLASMQMPEWDAGMAWDQSMAYHDPMAVDQHLWTDMMVPGDQDWGLSGMGGRYV